MKYDDIENRFTFHPADAQRARLHEQVRTRLKNTAHSLNILLEDGREKSTAITKLEEAMFWANAAIARENDE